MLRLPKQLSPGWPGLDLLASGQAQPLRRSLRLVSKYASLRLASGPVPQPACWRVLLATQPQAQVCMKQALPIQQPAQPSPRSQAFSRIRTFPTLDFGVPDPSLKLGWAEAGNAKRLQLVHTDKGSTKNQIAPSPINEFAESTPRG